MSPPSDPVQDFFWLQPDGGRWRVRCRRGRTRNSLYFLIFSPIVRVDGRGISIASSAMSSITGCSVIDTPGESGSWMENELSPTLGSSVQERHQEL